MVETPLLRASVGSFRVSRALTAGVATAVETAVETTAPAAAVASFFNDRLGGDLAAEAELLELTPRA